MRARARTHASCVKWQSAACMLGWGRWRCWEGGAGGRCASPARLPSPPPPLAPCPIVPHPGSARWGWHCHRGVAIAAMPPSRRPRSERAAAERNARACPVLGASKPREAGAGQLAPPPDRIREPERTNWVRHNEQAVCEVHRSTNRTLCGRWFK